MFSLPRARSGTAAVAMPAATVLANILLVIMKLGPVVECPGCRWRIGLRGRKWPRRRIGVDQPHGPFDCLGVHLLQVRVVPVVFGMTEGGIIDAPLAVHPRPRHCEISIGAMHPG